MGENCGDAKGGNGVQSDSPTIERRGSSAENETLHGPMSRASLLHFSLRKHAIGRSPFSFQRAFARCWVFKSLEKAYESISLV
jgi:hypothetical protein